MRYYFSLCILFTSCTLFNPKTETGGGIEKNNEIKNITGNNIEITHFIDKITNNAEVWSLMNNGGDMIAIDSKLKQFSDGQPAVLVCFWSDKDSAILARNKNWPNYKLFSIPLSEFLENHLTAMSRSYNYAGIDFLPSGYGTECGPLNLAIWICQDVRKKNIELNLKHFKDITEFEEKANVSRNGNE